MIGALFSLSIDGMSKEPEGEPQHKGIEKGKAQLEGNIHRDRKSTRLNSSHQIISYAVFCLKKKTKDCTSVTSSTRMPCVAGANKPTRASQFPEPDPA